MGERGLAPSRRRTVALFGEWNTSNLGDRAILEGARAFFEPSWYEVRPFNLGSLTSGEPSALSASPAATRMRPATDFARAHAPQALRAHFRGRRQHARARGLLPALEASDVIVVGGGALLDDRDLHFPQSLTALATVAHELTLPLICVGCGGGPWSGAGERALTAFLRSCAYVATRDSVTARRVSGVLGRDVGVFGDFALGDAAPPLAIGSGPLTVNVQRVPGGERADMNCQLAYERTVARLISQWLAAGDSNRAILVSTGPAEDLEPLMRVRELVPAAHVSVSVPTSTGELRQLLRRSRGVIASRLHAAILAMAEGRPVVGLGTSPKLGGFFAEVGLAGQCVDAFADEAPTLALQRLAAIEASPVAPNTSAFEAAREETLAVLHRLAEPAAALPSEGVAGAAGAAC